MPLLQYQQLSGPGLIPAIDALPAFRRIGHGGYGGLNPYLTHSIGQLSPSDAPFCAAAEFLALPLLPGGRFRCLLSPCDPSRNRTAPLPTKPRQTSRNRTGTFFVGGRTRTGVFLHLHVLSACRPVAAYSLCYTNIEAEAKAVISTAIHPCHFRQSIRFDVGPPFVGQEPLTRSAEELLCWWPEVIPACGTSTCRHRWRPNHCASPLRTTPTLKPCVRRLPQTQTVRLAHGCRPSVAPASACHRAAVAAQPARPSSCRSS